MLGLLLFNVDLIELFFECKYDNITSYADDTTPYSCAQDISFVISELQRIAKKNFDWCRNNHLKARSSLPNVFSKKGVLKNFAKFSGKHLSQSLFFNKVAGLRP